MSKILIKNYERELFWKHLGFTASLFFHYQLAGGDTEYDVVGYIVHLSRYMFQDFSVILHWKLVYNI